MRLICTILSIRLELNDPKRVGIILQLINKWLYKLLTNWSVSEWTADFIRSISQSSAIKQSVFDLDNLDRIASNETIYELMSLSGEQ